MINDATIIDSSMTNNLKIISKKQNINIGKKKLKVAAYCRVSTDLKVQETSIEIQMKALEKTIREHPEWQIVEIYSDKGKTGTKIKGRLNFLRMIEDAKQGKIDLILTKSASRVARNTIDMLKYTRMLRELGVGFYFEEENINTLNMTSELLLTVYAAFNQEESHEISESMKTSIRGRFKMGIPMKTKVYGYCIDSNGNWKIVERQAKTIRLIFDLLLESYNPTQIAKKLNENNVPTRTNRAKKWTCGAILDLVNNEKYTGDILMQKTYTIDHLNHYHKKNDDLLIPQYYLKNHHNPIINKQDYYNVHYLLKLRNPKQGYSQYPYYGYLVCPTCKSLMVSCKMNNHKIWLCPQCKSNIILESSINSILSDIFKQERISYKNILQINKITFPTSNKIEIIWKNNIKTKHNINNKTTSLNNSLINNLLIIMPNEKDEFKIPIVINENENK